MRNIFYLLVSTLLLMACQEKEYVEDYLYDDGAVLIVNDTSEKYKLTTNQVPCRLFKNYSESEISKRTNSGDYEIKIKRYSSNKQSFIRFFFLLDPEYKLKTFSAEYNLYLPSEGNSLVHFQDRFLDEDESISYNFHYDPYDSKLKFNVDNVIISNADGIVMDVRADVETYFIEYLK